MISVWHCSLNLTLSRSKFVSKTPPTSSLSICHDTEQVPR